ncbi:hypothetical protein BD770DRAFT_413122 [Pilaira anomala]|nr:hypothetical protein BD770DRAFT_413122 [Pilaira anomala]
MDDQHYQELDRLRNLTSLPSVQKVLDDLISERKVIREPIKRSNAEKQTIYLTTGYAWCQTANSVTLYVNFDRASELGPNDYSINVLKRSVELNIYEKKGANYSFKINQLNDLVIPESTTVKLKKDKIVITLFKQTKDYTWPDLRLKSTQNTYQQLERIEKKYAQSSRRENFQTPFNENTSPCPNHQHN